MNGCEAMHEIALMGDILNIVVRDMGEKSLHQVKKITLLVGDLSNAMPDALRMAFDIYKVDQKDWIHPDATLQIEHESAKAQCIFCNTFYVPDVKIALCPECNMPGGKLIQGETFQIISYEGD